MPKPTFSQSAREAVIGALLKTIGQPEVALRVRIAAAEILGYLGDPRLGELIAIPAGRFLFGDGDAVNTGDLQSEINLSGFWWRDKIFDTIPLAVSQIGRVFLVAHTQNIPKLLADRQPFQTASNNSIIASNCGLSC